MSVLKAGFIFNGKGAHRDWE